MPARTPTQSARKPASRRRGCLIAAGIAMLSVGVLIAIVAGVLVWKFHALRDEFSDTRQNAVTVTETNAETARRLSRTFEQMQRAVKEGRTDRFAFTDLQLNQMVATVPAVQDARGRAHFAIVDNHLKVEAAVPLDQVPGFQGRYLNGEFTLDIRMENGALRLHVLDAVVRGKPLPPAIMDHLRGMDLGEQAMQNPDVRKQLSGIRALRIEDGKLVLETGR